MADLSGQIGGSRSTFGKVTTQKRVTLVTGASWIEVAINTSATQVSFWSEDDDIFWVIADSVGDANTKKTADEICKWPSGSLLNLDISLYNELTTASLFVQTVIAPTATLGFNYHYHEGAG